MECGRVGSELLNKERNIFYTFIFPISRNNLYIFLFDLYKFRKMSGFSPSPTPTSFSIGHE